MKFTTILILLFTLNGLFAQTEFAPIGAEWYYDKPVPFYDVGYVRFRSLNDTIINEKTCKVIERKNFKVNGDSIKWANEYLHQSGDTVFYFANNKFWLMYNFSLKKEDTLEFFTHTEHPCGETDTNGYAIIDSVYTRSINGINVDVQQCSPTETSVWDYYIIIKDIGHYTGFYPKYVNTCDIMDQPNFIGSLRCYKDKSNGLRNFSNAPCDTLIGNTTALPVEIVAVNNFKIYPNITSGFVTIENRSDKNQLTPYCVYNANGQQKLKGFLSPGKNNINLTNMPNGIYFIQINNNRQITFKIIAKII